MGDWDAIIDVSNVCWSPVLPPVGRRRAVWERLALVMAAWRREHGDGARLYLVADDSLFRSLSGTEELRRLRADGDLVTAPVADPVILRLARDRGLHVITHDHYVDHRDRHPWIEASPGRFHGWEMDGDEVRIAPLGIAPRSAQEISMAIELKDLKRTRLDPRSPAHRRILHTRWRCDNASCSQVAHSRGQLLAWPMVSAAGLAVCPSCNQPLTDLGPRAQLFEAVVAERATQAEIMRFPLETDVPVIVGRGTIKGIDLSIAVLPSPGRSPAPTSLTSARQAVARVSRLHLLLRIEEVSAVNWRLAVIDLDSTNGTEVERWAGAGFLPSREVPADKETFLSARDRVVLGGAVQLRLSGKRYMMDRGAPASSIPQDPGDFPPRGDATIVSQITISDAQP
jgi:hypothetical protein